MEGVRRSPIFNPMGLPTSTQASRGNGSYLSTEDMSKAASLKPVEIPVVAMDPILGNFGDPDAVPVDVKNGPPTWLYYVTAAASVITLFHVLTRKK